MTKSVLPALALLMLATPALSACGTYTYGTCADGIVHWFDPNTGEICDPLNCGGDRAGPLRTDVPGCPAYKGTLTRPTEPSYMPCWTGFSSTAAATTTAATTTTTVVSSHSSAAPSASSGSGQSQVGSTTAGTGASSTAPADAPSPTASSTTMLTTTAPTSTSPADTGTGAAGASSTTVSTGAGSVMSGSWIAVVAGVGLGALAIF
ncbi:uncharacterized protein B0T15DRAFT_106706 [Chaetomium strumarium]|uniref:Siderophore biosynthesis n=1 Tax=Chaetomium strumarium TaxID=1170767 RepID=A0AAJ0GYE0_9PEZI|nr:hypothetical protein B0T15DRAFT_106706 [Chaetomium strumarium]